MHSTEVLKTDKEKTVETTTPLKRMQTNPRETWAPLIKKQKLSSVIEIYDEDDEEKHFLTQQNKESVHPTLDPFIKYEEPEELTTQEDISDDDEQKELREREMIYKDTMDFTEMISGKEKKATSTYIPAGIEHAFKRYARVQDIKQYEVSTVTHNVPFNEACCLCDKEWDSEQIKEFLIVNFNITDESSQMRIMELSEQILENVEFLTRELKKKDDSVRKMNNETREKFIDRCRTTYLTLRNDLYMLNFIEQQKNGFTIILARGKVPQYIHPVANYFPLNYAKVHAAMPYKGIRLIRMVYYIKPKKPINPKHMKWPSNTTMKPDACIPRGNLNRNCDLFVTYFMKFAWEIHRIMDVHTWIF